MRQIVTQCSKFIAALFCLSLPVVAQQAVIHREIVVSIPDRRLALLENGEVLRVYAVAVGAHSSPSPTGDFSIVNRLENPTYYHPGEVVEPGDDNPLGTRWMGLSQKGFGIHGTNMPWTIGQAASHGCIRMDRDDLEELFAMVHVGDTVHIVPRPDEQTAAIFAAPEDQAEEETTAATATTDRSPQSAAEPATR
jgi:lipoprotein-anchoring transpeptidase ErfK/SrfK